MTGQFLLTIATALGPVAYGLSGTILVAVIALSTFPLRGGRVPNMTSVLVASDVVADVVWVLVSIEPALLRYAAGHTNRTLTYLSRLFAAFCCGNSI